MWEPGSNSSNSSKSASNRDIILLVGTLSSCFFLYHIWGPLLFITCSLIFVVHTCYSLYIHDSLFAPQSVELLRHAGKFSLQLAQTTRILASLVFIKFKEGCNYLKVKYKERKKRFLEVEEDMNSRQRNAYRLSTSGTDYGEKAGPNNTDAYNLFSLNGSSNNPRCSTPLPIGGLHDMWKKEVQQNGGFGLLKHPGPSPIRKSQTPRSENRQPVIMLPRNEEALYNSKGSPWSNNLSQKIDKSPSIKPIQTVSGPLLASTRFNIDPKIYTDVSSPGLTSRITKYAAEANCKLTHQSQYGPGQFPKVNLNAMPTPIISPKTIRARKHVTVRVAPPDVVNYSMHDNHSFQDRHKLFSNTSGSEIKETKACPSVNQVLKEISLKRHASREDIMLELVKKQRTERISEGQLENLEEMMQKRARDESSDSDEDLSPFLKNQDLHRPPKRSKSSSCHDILNSLSSSINVYSGVKRKAMDSLQSDSLDNEKHFKASSKSPDCSITSASSSFSSSRDPAKSKEQLNIKVPVVIVPKELSPKFSEKISVNAEINQTIPEKKQILVPKIFDQAAPIRRESVITKTSNLEDKLFMKAEPQPNRKLKILVEEQTNVEAKFQTDDKDEIKKQDIDNMKQNSMRLRLQSMYDAISGKTSSKIDPDVVIQAEEVNPPASSTNFITLSSLTSTTTVNTSPITTTIIPILKSDTDGKSTTPKHVTFNIPSVTSSCSVTSPVPSVSTASNSEKLDLKSAGSEPPASTGFGIKTSSSLQTFNFGNAVSTTSNTTNLATITTTSAPASSFTPNVNTSENKNTSTVNANNIIVNSASFVSKSTSANPSSTFNANSSSFSFGGNDKLSSNSAALTSTTLTQSTGVSNTNSFSSFVNTNSLTKSSPNNSSISQPTSLSLNFASDKKESGFSFSTASMSSTSNITSNVNSTATTLFGGPSKPNVLFGANSISNTSSTPSTTSATPVFSFGAGANKITESTGFSFNAATSSTTSTTATTATIPFGTNAPPGGGSGFGITSGASASIGSNAAFSNQPQSLFNTSASTPSLFSGSTSSTAMFKSPTSTSTATLFGATANNTSTGFGSSVSVAATTAPSLFGNIANNPTISSPFQNVANSPAVSTPGLTSFSGSTQQQNQPGNIFGSTVSTTAASVFGPTATTLPSSSLFSGNTNISGSTIANLAAQTGSSEGIFGQTKPSTLNFGANNSSFGASNSTFSAPVTNSSTFQISSTPTTSGLPTFNTIKSTISFGASTNEAPTSTTTAGSIFGSNTNTGFGGATSSSFGSPATVNTFGTTASGISPAFGSSNFGSSTVPAATTFGSTTASSIGSNFGGATAPGANSTFGNAAAPNAASTFGNSTAPSANATFGSSVAPAATSTFGGSSTSGASSPFGNQTSGPVTSNIFGNASNNSGSSAFTFGGGATQAQSTQPQPQTSFNFGGSSSNASNSGGVFQFGGATAVQPKPAGFNFSAPTGAPTINFTGGAAAPPTFNAPNMFSIGSGSSTPRSRTSRARRQR